MSFSILSGNISLFFFNTLFFLVAFQSNIFQSTSILISPFHLFQELESMAAFGSKFNFFFFLLCCFVVFSALNYYICCGIFYLLDEGCLCAGARILSELYSLTSQQFEL